MFNYFLNNKGFTLVELMISVVILTIALLTAAGLQITATKANTSAKWATGATTLTEKKIEELKGKGFSGLTNTDWTTAEKLNEDGTSNANGRYSRQWKITEPITNSLKLVEVRVTWASFAGTSKQCNLTIYVAR